ncbi:MAG: DNA replication/repair protein RecF [Pseudomonadota bacterium]
MLTLLEARNFRCLDHVRLEPHPHLNLIEGRNASGKTSLLEAIFILGRGRSFRTARASAVVQDGTDGFTVFGRIEENERSQAIGVQFAGGKTIGRIAGENIDSLAQLAEALPVQVVDPEVHDLVEEGPGERRRFLDWGVFHVEPRFLEVWRQYQRGLRQRNAGLRQGLTPDALSVWEQQMIAAALEVDRMRRAYLDLLVPVVEAMGERLLETALTVKYQPGWPVAKEYAQALNDNRARDSELGSTSVGPHRANVVLQLDNRTARSRASRGQQKLLGAALVLAQFQLLQQEEGRGGVMLLDDPSAELDKYSLERFLSAARALGIQLFVTALNPKMLPIDDWPATFHVEQGKVHKVL